MFIALSATDSLLTFTNPAGNIDEPAKLPGMSGKQIELRHLVDRRPRLLVPYSGTLLEPMLKDQRASVFLALTVALTITVTWGP